MPVVTSLKPMEEQTAKPSKLPYEQPGQLTPITNAPKTTQPQSLLQKGSDAVMQAAQQNALSKANQQSPTMGLVQQGVQGLIKKPMGESYDAEKYKQNQLEQFDRNRAQSMAAFQQQNADVANTGVNREAAYNFAMQGAQGRSDLEQKINREQQDAERQALLNALQLGTSTEQAQSGLDTEAFNRLINARAAYEGEANRQTQEKLTSAQLSQNEAQFMANLKQSGQQFTDELAYKKYATDAGLTNEEAQRTWQSIQNEKQLTQNESQFTRNLAQSGQQFNTEAEFKRYALQAGLTENEAQRTWQANQAEKQQNFQATQASLDRAQQLALQSNDQRGQMDLASLQGRIQQGLKVTEQDFEAAQSALTRQLQVAMQSNDITAQKDIQAAQSQLQKEMQTKQLQDNALQAGLDRAQQILLQSNDQAGQVNLAVVQGNIQKGLKVSDQQFAAAESSLARQLQVAMQTNDIAAQKDIQNAQSKLQREMQLNQQDFQASQATMDRAQQLLVQKNDRAGQAELATLQGNIQKGLQISTQDFQTVQASLDRQLEVAKQSNDIQAQKDIQAAQSQLQRDMQANQLRSTENQNQLDRVQQIVMAAGDRLFQESMEKLKNSNQLGQMSAQNNYDIVLEKLSQQGQSALQSGDIAAQKDIAVLKGNIEAQAQANQLKWQTAERVASEGWQTGERLSEQSYNTATNYIAQQNAVALQSNDINAQKYLADQKAKLDLQMQTNDMTQEEKMANLNAKLAEAKANGDVGREKQIMEFQTIQNIETMYKEFGYDQAMKSYEFELNRKLNEGEYAQAAAMQRAQFTFQGSEAAKDRTLETMKIDLQQQGIDMQKVNQIMEGAASGAIDSDAAINAIKTIASDLGVTVKAPDPMKQQQDVDNQYQLMQYQFGKTHPEMVNTDGTLTDAGIKQFNAWQNQAQNTPDIVTAATIKDIGSKIKANPADFIGAANENNPSNADYKALLLASPSFDQTVKKSTVGNKSHYIFSAQVPAIRSIVNIGGTLYRVDTEPSVNAISGGWDAQQFKATNINTGVQEIIGPTK